MRFPPLPASLGNKLLIDKGRGRKRNKVPGPEQMGSGKAMHPSAPCRTLVTSYSPVTSCYSLYPWHSPLELGPRQSQSCTRTLLRALSSPCSTRYAAGTAQGRRQQSQGTDRMGCDSAAPSGSIFVTLLDQHDIQHHGSAPGPEPHHGPFPRPRGQRRSAQGTVDC